MGRWPKSYASCWSICAPRSRRSCIVRINMEPYHERHWILGIMYPRCGCHAVLGNCRARRAFECRLNGSSCCFDICWSVTHHRLRTASPIPTHHSCVVFHIVARTSQNSSCPRKSWCGSGLELKGKLYRQLQRRKGERCYLPNGSARLLAGKQQRA